LPLEPSYFLLILSFHFYSYRTSLYCRYRQMILNCLQTYFLVKYLLFDNYFAKNIPRGAQEVKKCNVDSVA